jgi:hypothetical protein
MINSENEVLKKGVQGMDACEDEIDRILAELNNKIYLLNIRKNNLRHFWLI